MGRAPWTRTVGVLDGLSGEGIHAASTSRRHALFVTAAYELVDPDAPPPEPTPSGLPFIPETRLRWWIEAWDVHGELAWTRDLTTKAVATGECLCEQEVHLVGDVAGEAAPALGRDAFVLLGTTEDEDTGTATSWLARVRVAL